MESTISQIISAALAFERQGAQFYQQQVSLTTDPTGKQMFTKLANDELRHAYWLEKMQSEIVQTGSASMPTPNQLATSFGGLTRLDFPAPAAYASGAPDAHQLDALEFGIKIEIESRDFYDRASRQVSDAGAHAVLARFVEVEEQHRILLQGEYDYLTNSGMYFGMPDFTLEGMNK
jgi:rubrerythrin